MADQRPIKTIPEMSETTDIQDDDRFISYTDALGLEQKASPATVAEAVAKRGGVKSLNSIADLQGLSGVEGQQVHPAGYHPDSTDGGGIFVWGTGVHNGGTFIDPNRTFPTPAQWAAGSSDPAVIAWLDTSGGTVDGWVRLGVEYVTPEMFGADNSGGSISTSSCQAVIKTGLPVDWGSNNVFAVDDDIGDNYEYTTPLIWKAENVIIKTVSASQVDIACRVRLTAQHGYVGNIVFDGSNITTQGLLVLNDSPNMSDSNLSRFFLERTSVRNFKKATLAGTGCEGIQIRGGFSFVSLDRVSVRNFSMVSGAGTPGSSGVNGVTVTHYGLSGYAKVVSINGIQVDTVKNDDGTYEADQDGIKVFAPHVESGGVPVDTVLFVGGGSSFKNCWGRSIKSQMFQNTVTDSAFYRNDGFDSKIGNGEIELQVSGGNVNNINCFYDDGYVPATIVSFSSSETGGADYQKSSYSASDISVFLKNFTGAEHLPAAIQTFPGGGLIGPVIVDKVRVLGAPVLHLLDYLVNGGDEINQAFISNCYVDELSVSADTGNRALIQTRASGDEASFAALVSIEKCVYGGINAAFVSDNRIAGVQADATVSSVSNIGFVDDPQARPSGNQNEEIAQVFRVGKIGARQEAGKPSGRTGSHTVFSKIVNAGTTGVFDVRCEDGSIYLAAVNEDRDHAAIFIADNTGTTIIHSSSGLAIGGTSNPSSADFNLWVSGSNEISVENTTTGNNAVTLWELSPI